jgi:hypothetical protein
MFPFNRNESSPENRSIFWLVIATLIVIPFIAGLLTFRNYGESTDENSLYVSSDYSLRAYHDLFLLGLDAYQGKGITRYYGPAFLMAANLFARALDALANGLIKTDAWHLTYFLSFQVCALAFYFLAKRWLQTRTALATSLLFLFQPLLWGHAFINPKDIPFMTFFLLSVLSGLIMQERLFPVEQAWDFPASARLQSEWRNARPSDRVKAILFLLSPFLPFAFCIFGQTQLTGLLTGFVITVYAASGDNILNRILLLFAQNYRAVPAELYAAKLLKFVNLGLFAAALVVLVVSVFHFRRILPQTLSFLNRRSSMQFARNALTCLRNPFVLLAGIILGLTISVRIIGPLAGMIAALVMFSRGKSKALPVLTAYSIIAVIVAYLTWPYLWPDPIGRFENSLVVMSEFPWDGKVLFNGTYYPSGQLPLSYVPFLFGIQFTEPAVLLFIAGLCLFVLLIWKRAVAVDFSLLVITWGLLPFIIFTVLRPSLYDNFRQLFFILPPLFLLIGLALEKLFQFLNKIHLQILLTILLLLAGILPMVHLHPYEYVYYNSFVGGVRGAARRFEADYWATAFREAIEYVNRIAPPGARVIVFAGGTTDKVTRFARPDLVIDSSNNTRFDPATGYTYAIITTRADRDQKDFTDWITLYRIERNGNLFCVVKQNPAP